MRSDKEEARASPNMALRSEKTRSALAEFGVMANMMRAAAAHVGNLCVVAVAAPEEQDGVGEGLHARRVDHDTHARGEVGVHLGLHAHDQVVVGEGLDVIERVDTVGAQVLRGVRRVERGGPRGARASGRTG